MRKIEIISHRGARCYMPENSIPGYRAALVQGVDWVDVDVVATKDEVLIAYHDLMINPNILCDTHGQFLATSKSELLQTHTEDVADLLIRNFTYTQLQEKYRIYLNSQSSYSKFFPKQAQVPDLKIVSLQEVIDYVDLVSNKEIKFQIEIKNNPANPQWTYSPEKLAELVYAFLLKNDLVLRCKIQAFDWRILAILNQFDERIKTAYLDAEDEAKTYWQEYFKDSIVTDKASELGIQAGDSLLPLVKALGGYSYEPEDIFLTKDMLDDAAKLGLKVFVWRYPEHSGSAFDANLMHELINWGIDGFITDDPAALSSMLANNGYPTPKQYHILHAFKLG